MKTLKINSDIKNPSKQNEWPVDGERITSITIHKEDVLLMHYKDAVIEKVVDAILLKEHPCLTITVGEICEK